jgi:Clr5 domain
MDQTGSESLDPWASVKPVLEFLWLTEDWKLSRIVQEMRIQHNFHRVCVMHLISVIINRTYKLTSISKHQYKSQFSRWGWPKNVRKSDMTKVIRNCKSRAAAGKLATQVAIKGKQVDGHKMRRAIKDEIRAVAESLTLDRSQISTLEGNVLPFTNNL